MKALMAAFVFVFAWTSMCVAEAKRPLKVEDFFALKDVSDPQISPDGKWVAYVVGYNDATKDDSFSNIFMAPAAGGAPVQVTFSGQDEDPRWSPDNQYLAFKSSRDKKAQVYVINRAGGEAYPVTTVAQGVRDFEWSPDSKKLLLVIKDADPDKPADDDEKAAPAPYVITRLFFKWDGVGYLKELYKHLYVLDIATRSLKQITSGAWDDADPITGSYDSSPPHWSPDGKWIVFVSNRTAEPDANENTDIYVVSAEGGEPRKLTTNEGPDEMPSWSPDGKSIVYATQLEPQYLWYDQLKLAVIPAAGGSPQILTKDLDRNLWDPVYGPDGRLYFMLEDGGTQRLVSMPAQGGKIAETTQQKIVRQFDLGSKGVVAVQAARPDAPDEIYMVSGGKENQISHANDDFLKTVEVGKTERIQFNSKDGTPISGFVIKPPAFDAAKKYPAILWPHGGPNEQETGEFYLRPQVLAAQGYVVILIDYRGSTGYGKHFQQSIWKDWGNKEIDDLLAGLDFVISKGYVDSDKLGMGGHSYGAILTDYMMVKSGRFKAFITDAGESNFLMDYGVDQYLHDWEAEVGKPWENPQRYVEMSPYFHLKDAKTPTLIICGQQDWNVPLVNSEQLYLSLRRLGVETMLVVYPEQPHEFWRPSYIADRYRRNIAWYNHYLKGDPNKVPLAAK